MSWVILPVTCTIFAAWSSNKVNKDCNRILKIFDDAFYLLKFKTLLNYIKTFKDTIAHLKLIGEKIVDEEESKNQTK